MPEPKSIPPDVPYACIERALGVMYCGHYADDDEFRFADEKHAIDVYTQPGSSFGVCAKCVSEWETHERLAVALRAPYSLSS